MASWSQFVIVDAINQILRSDSLMQLRNTNGPRNGKRMLYESGGNGHYPLKCDFATLAAIVLLGIASSRGEICIKIGIAQVPTIGHKITPLLWKGARQRLSSSNKEGIN